MPTPPQLDKDSDVFGAGDKIRRAKGTFGGWMFNVLVMAVFGLAAYIVFQWNLGSKEFARGYTEGKNDGLVICSSVDTQNENLTKTLNGKNIEIDSLKLKILMLNEQILNMRFSKVIIQSSREAEN